MPSTNMTAPARDTMLCYLRAYCLNLDFIVFHWSLISSFAAHNNSYGVLGTHHMLAESANQNCHHPWMLHKPLLLALYRPPIHYSSNVITVPGFLVRLLLAADRSDNALVPYSPRGSAGMLLQLFQAMPERFLEIQ